MTNELCASIRTLTDEKIEKNVLKPLVEFEDSYKSKAGVVLADASKLWDNFALER